MKENEIVHVAKLDHSYLYLRKTGADTFEWFLDEEGTGVKGITPEEACRLARKAWALRNFRFLRCGTRFTLPERDECGTNALYHQMAASYSVPNHIYYDEELGHSCVVREASEEALALWRSKR